MKTGKIASVPAATHAASKREPATQVRRIKAEKAIREIASHFKLGKDEASALKAALVRNAREAGKNFKTYVSYFWSMLSAKGGIKKFKKSQVLTGDVFALA